MGIHEFVARRVYWQLVKLRGTRGSITVDVGEGYYQLASYDGNQLLAEISSNEFLPHGAALDGLAQKELVRLGFQPPNEDWPNWSIRIDDGSGDALVGVAEAMASALVDCAQASVPDLIQGLLWEYIESHQDTALDPPWAEVLYGESTGA